jgi:D-beta-D-heptose 7-phosphate kinase/D-beta-D-heptose 1-phosphate adenosyltransferase
MVLSVLGLALGGGLPPEIAVQLANVAAGLEVDRTGVVALTREEIRRELDVHQLHSRRKVMSLAELARLREEYRRRGQTVVLTNGCFDLLHVGHVTYLEEAAALGDVLIVAMNSDASVRRLKGPQRPVIGADERAGMLAALGCVSHVVIFDEDTPHTVLQGLRPDVLVKGGTYQPWEVVGHEIVTGYGGQVIVTGFVPGVSTTEIVRAVQQRTSFRQAG